MSFPPPVPPTGGQHDPPLENSILDEILDDANIVRTLLFSGDFQHPASSPPAASEPAGTAGAPHRAENFAQFLERPERNLVSIDETRPGDMEAANAPTVPLPATNALAPAAIMPPPQVPQEYALPAEPPLANVDTTDPRGAPPPGTSTGTQKRKRKSQYSFSKKCLFGSIDMYLDPMHRHLYDNTPGQVVLPPELEGQIVKCPSKNNGNKFEVAWKTPQGCIFESHVQKSFPKEQFKQDMVAAIQKYQDRRGTVGPARTPTIPRVNASEERTPTTAERRGMAIRLSQTPMPEGVRASVAAGTPPTVERRQGAAAAMTAASISSVPGGSQSSSVSALTTPSGLPFSLDDNSVSDAPRLTRSNSLATLESDSDDGEELDPDDNAWQWDGNEQAQEEYYFNNPDYDNDVDDMDVPQNTARGTVADDYAATRMRTTFLGSVKVRADPRQRDHTGPLLTMQWWLPLDQLAKCAPSSNRTTEN